jgi:hypothetical protein
MDCRAGNPAAPGLRRGSIRHEDVITVEHIYGAQAFEVISSWRSLRGVLARQWGVRVIAALVGLPPTDQHGLWMGAVSDDWLEQHLANARKRGADD